MLRDSGGEMCSCGERGADGGFGCRDRILILLGVKAQECRSGPANVKSGYEVINGGGIGMNNDSEIHIRRVITGPRGSTRRFTIGSINHDQDLVIRPVNRNVQNRGVGDAFHIAGL